MRTYNGIHWLRALGCVSIMAMHMMVNNTYAIGGFLYRQVIPSLADFVFPFMAISAFCMCSGYFDQVMAGQINWTSFYKKRYGRILPFFLFLILIDLALNFSLPSLREGLAEATLLHGFIPAALSVIGVGWFLGIVFIFYLIFPFFCVLIETKARAWCAFGISVLVNHICGSQWGLERTNFLYSFCFFLAGGLLYLYRDQLRQVKWYIHLAVLLLALGLYYGVAANTATRLLLTAAMLALAVSGSLPNSRVITFLSGISLEFYLSHMAVFRAVALFGLNRCFGNGWGQYLITVFLVLMGTIAFSRCFQVLQKSLFRRPRE